MQNEPQLTDEELIALRSMREFQQAIYTQRVAKEYERLMAEKARNERKNPDGTWKHDRPGANPNRKDGLWGKAAQAADGDWYGSH